MSIEQGLIEAENVSWVQIDPAVEIYAGAFRATPTVLDLLLYGTPGYITYDIPNEFAKVTLRRENKNLNFAFRN